MCSGRVDLSFIFKAFANGADGVFVGGCRLGECHYLTHGNYIALNTVILAKRILEYLGLSPQRVRIEFMGSSDGLIFARVVDEFITTVERLGPLGEGEGVAPDAVRERLERLLRLVPYIKTATRDRLTTRAENPQRAQELITLDDVEKLFKGLFAYRIDADKCKGCGVCAGRCPVSAISGERKKPHKIDEQACILCGTCFDVCKFDAIEKVSVEPLLPVRSA